MQVDNRLFDDVARLMNGALGSLAGFKNEVDALIRQRLERLLADMALVHRDEFEAVKAVAANARAAQEALEEKVERLERALAAAGIAPPEAVSDPDLEEKIGSGGAHTAG
ncbi:MAG TPA: accessory factor UbiK family protein [Alphaproteobacteria bacterium]|nr:accessory factor UbiK family protein [Alphaproteobacteria bacterium]